MREKIRERKHRCVYQARTWTGVLGGARSGSARPEIEMHLTVTCPKDGYDEILGGNTMFSEGNRGKEISLS
jgi:hypothetical protein